jgi:hypothetical protein
MRHVCEFICFEDDRMHFCGDKFTGSYADKCGDLATDFVSFACIHRDGTGEDRKTCDCPEDFWLCPDHLAAFWKWQEGYEPGYIEP